MNKISSPSTDKFGAASFFACLAPFVSVIHPAFLRCQNTLKHEIEFGIEKIFHHLQLYTSGKTFPYDQRTVQLEHAGLHDSREGRGSSLYGRRRREREYISLDGGDAGSPNHHASFWHFGLFALYVQHYLGF